jgi:hypothetical protein
LEQSYFCAEQIGQMQASYDSFVMVKIAHDAGCDLVNNPIDFYCYDFGGQIPVFWNCLKRIFGEIEMQNEGYNEHGSTMNSFKLPMTELKALFPLLNPVERDECVNKFNAMMKTCDEYFGEFEMEGFVSGNCLQVTITGEYGIYSPLLGQLVAIRNEVRQQIRARREKIVNGLRSVALVKTVYDRLGIVVEVSLDAHVNVVFSQIMKQCNNMDIALESGDPFSYEAMIKMLNTTLLHNQAVIKTKREDVAA